MCNPHSLKLFEAAKAPGRTRSSRGASRVKELNPTRANNSHQPWRLARVPLALVQMVKSSVQHQWKFIRSNVLNFRLGTRATVAEPPSKKRKRDEAAAIRASMEARLEETALALPSEYEDEIVQHPAMAEAVRHERLLREGFARDALDDLRMHITTHASLVDRKKQHSGVVWNTGMDTRLARKQQAIDAAATQYRTLRNTLLDLGMDENDSEFRRLEDNDKKAFVIITEEQVLGDSRRKPSWIWGDFSFIGKSEDNAIKTFMLDSK